ncbi:protein-export membrane protein SecD [Candidatus Blochmanniella vafra str. BVAF]|uniref:Protein translocase subunit SecD n=1 Tax=Blochmanniella vafra (strain BVAF) TaxID=859654 RepID=E8Q615_BLOVB|nr:protein translocase subunit SecD [Candidatus Blochmannia vafer]ADV33631.1 protein-export membrane protein SecD [Candidatus Blochmannia vafer str. BVAF]
MINSYPIWKYVIVFLVLIIGCIYMLPNLYQENYAISIVKNDLSNCNIYSISKSNILNILKKEKIISKSIFFHDDKIQICFFSELDQKRAYGVLFSIFSENFSVSCLKIPDMPNWLYLIGAKPIQLGLDLKGGLYLIIRVDIQTMLNKLQDYYFNNFKSILNENNIFYLRLNKINDYDLKIVFENADIRNKSILYLSKIYPELIFYTKEECIVCISFSKEYIHTMCEYAIQQNSNILRHRINQLQITEPLIHRYGSDCIVIELPGIQDSSKIKTIFNNAASLEFRLVNTKINEFQINNNFIPEDSEIKLDSNGNIIALYKKVILTGDHIIGANLNFDEYHRPRVNILLDNLGSLIISKFTQDNIGKVMATLFVEYKDTGEKDKQGYSILYRYDKVINIATIQSKLSHNFCIIGINNVKEARYLSSLLSMGSLIAPIYIEEERVIGPTLGKKNIAQGITACVLGILISIFFMITWYRFFGLIAGVALIVNLILMVSLMSLIPGVILTMPSIAGVILTLAVSIDSNVLINERIKEEIKQGKPMQYSIYVGYRKAFTSIIDANITTIIVSIILYIISTGPIQGFAMVTIIGVGTSMFTSIIGTRAFVNLIYGKRYIKKLSI